MSGSEYHAGWLAASMDQPVSFGMSADWLAGYRDCQQITRTAPRRRYSSMVPA